MFGWFKRRLAARMDAQANIAQLAMAMALLSHFRVQQAPNDAEKSARAAKASAVANHFFGKESDLAHTRGFDLPSLYEEGNAWLQKNPLFKELVVQSLRVLNTVEFARTGKAPVIGESLLVQFGPEFPLSPNPETYAALVAKAVESLPPEEQASVKRFLTQSR